MKEKVTGKFNVGDTVYVATCGNESTQVTCPVCFGKLVVTLILGDESHVELPCRHCASGCDPPRGTVAVWSSGGHVSTRVITDIHTETSSDGEAHRYLAGHRSSDDTDTFATKDEAQKHAAVLAEEERVKQTSRAEYLKKDNLKSYSWNAGYHLRHAKSDRKNAEYHDKMAVLCKERAKGSNYQKKGGA